ncbi:MAG: redox-regulated ATPase YchF [Spirochaetales bacterium]|nr:redox-regulated ATPase YchF [Spirochaetales bacterium]
MNIGLVGLPKSGKTTIFNALSGETAEVSAYQSGKPEPNRAMVQVDDGRVDKLAAMYNPRKTVYAQLELVDFAGLSAGAERGGLFSGEAFAALKSCDALALVLRNFDSDEVTAQHGGPRPAEELLTLTEEFLLADQMLLERRLERVRDDLKKGKRNGELTTEERLLSLLLERVEAGEAVRDIDLNPHQLKQISGYSFLTAKPVFAVLNSGEEQYGKSHSVVETIEKSCPVVEFAGKFEMELAVLEPEESAEFMDELGISQSAKERLTGFAYSLLGYSSFFTVGADEVRAWTIRRGASAVEAAGVIHSDLARGFIRAECFSYQDLETHGDERELKNKGLVRLEGKEYQVRDGDILNIRFSV